MSAKLKRREFITLLGGAAAGWPLAARAQQTAMPIVGYVPASDRPERLALFKSGLAESGFVEGRNVIVEPRSAEGRYDRFPELVADLVRKRVAVIAVPGSQSAAIAAKAATETIPIVFAVAEDPVKLGLVASLSQPGGNATGINFFTEEVVAKRLALLREFVPGARRVAALLNPSDRGQTESTERQLKVAALICCMRATARRSMPPSRRFCGSDPTRCSSVPTDITTAVACNSPFSRRCVQFPPRSPRTTMSKWAA